MNRRAHQAIDGIVEAVRHGKTEIIDADLSKYFDTIPHRELMRQVARRVSDGSVLKLIKDLHGDFCLFHKFLPWRSLRPWRGFLCRRAKTRSRPPDLECRDLCGCSQGVRKLTTAHSLLKEGLSFRCAPVAMPRFANRRFANPVRSQSKRLGTSARRGSLRVVSNPLQACATLGGQVTRRSTRGKPRRL